MDTDDDTDAPTFPPLSQHFRMDIQMCLQEGTRWEFPLLFYLTSEFKYPRNERN